MFVATDEVLEQLICTNCKKYLSVKPVKVYYNKSIRCGRLMCSSPFGLDGGVLSLFSILAEETLFRCINRFERCNQLLTYSEVESHEATCHGGNYECPNCQDPFKGTAYHMYVHYKEQHGTLLLLQSSELLVNLDKELDKTYLHRQNDFLFYIHVTYDKILKELHLSVSYLGKDSDASRISQKCTLSSVDGIIVHKTIEQACNSVTHRNLMRINLAERTFTGNVLVCKVTLNTSSLEQMLGVASIGNTLQFKAPSIFKFGKFGLPDVKPSPKPIQFQAFNRPHPPARKKLLSAPAIPEFRPVHCKIELIETTPGDNHFIVPILQSITEMKDYKHTSFEELRYEYYQAVQKEQDAIQGWK